MKKSLRVMSLCLIACTLSAGSVSIAGEPMVVFQQEPPGIKAALVSTDPGYQKAHLRCRTQNPCTGVTRNEALLNASVGNLGVSAWVNQKIQLKDSSKKTGQFVPGGSYVAGVWQGSFQDHASNFT